MWQKSVGRAERIAPRARGCTARCGLQGLRCMWPRTVQPLKKRFSPRWKERWRDLALPRSRPVTTTFLSKICTKSTTLWGVTFVKSFSLPEFRQKNPCSRINSDRPTILRLTSWGRGANPPTLVRERSRAWGLYGLTATILSIESKSRNINGAAKCVA